MSYAVQIINFQMDKGVIWVLAFKYILNCFLWLLMITLSL